MTTQFRRIVAVLWISAMPGMLLADEPATQQSSKVVTASELTVGASCRITTKRKGRIGVCCEGTVEAVEQEQITIVVKRAQVTQCMAFGWQLCEAWQPLKNQEIEIATDAINRIRLLQGPISKKTNEQ